MNNNANTTLVRNHKELIPLADHSKVIQRALLKGKVIVIKDFGDTTTLASKLAKWLYHETKDGRYVTRKEVGAVLLDFTDRPKINREMIYNTIHDARFHLIEKFAINVISIPNVGWKIATLGEASLMFSGAFSQALGACERARKYGTCTTPELNGEAFHNRFFNMKNAGQKRRLYSRYFSKNIAPLFREVRSRAEKENEEIPTNGSEPKRLALAAPTRA